MKNKRTFSICIVVLVISLFIAVFAAKDLTGLKGTGEITDLHDYFETNGWPETVSYAYLDSDKLTVGMIDVSDEAVGEILALVDPTVSVEIVKCDYSHSYLVETRDEILERFTDYGIDRAWLADDDDHVIVIVPGDRYQVFLGIYSSLYGDAVEYHAEGEVQTMADNMGGLGGTMIVMTALIIVFILLAMVFKKMKADRERQRKLDLIEEERMREKHRYR